MSKLNFSISQTNEHIKIEVEGGEVILSATELDTVILNLAKIRASMKPEIPKTLDPNPVFHNSVPGASFIVSAGMSGPQAKPDVVLAALHPGMGWIAFPIKPVEALQLSQAIGTQALRLQQAAPLVGLNGKPL